MSDAVPLPTSDEVDRRLLIVSELRNLCLSLGEAGRRATAARTLTGPTLPQAEVEAGQHH